MCGVVWVVWVVCWAVVGWGGKKDWGWDWDWDWGGGVPGELSMGSRGSSKSRSLSGVGVFEEVVFIAMWESVSSSRAISINIHLLRARLCGAKE